MNGPLNFLVILWIFSLSCSNGQMSDIQIFNGRPADSQEPAAIRTVGLVTDGQVFCSGFIVSSRLVLTAAHCLTNSDHHPLSQNISIYLGEGAEGGTVPLEDTYPVEGGKTHPDYDAIPMRVGQFDTAYLVLKTPISNLPPVEMVKGGELWESLQTGAPFAVMGFGLRGDGFGLKYQVRSKVDSYTVNELTFRGASGDACPGDSGGPVFSEIDGRLKLIGLISRGDGPNCRGRKSGGDGKDTLTPSTTYVSLINDSWCFFGSSSALEASFKDYCFNNLEGHSDDYLKEDTYLTICESTDSTISQRQTLAALERVSLKTNCQDSSTVLFDSGELDLSRAMISDLSPLLGLPIHTLNLLGNRLGSIKPLFYLENLSSLKVDFREADLHAYVSLKGLRENIDIEFSMDLWSIYGGFGYIEINKRPQAWFDAFVALGLAPEKMLMALMDGENRPILLHLIRQIKIFEDDYIYESVFEYAAERNDREMLRLIHAKKGK